MILGAANLTIIDSELYASSEITSTTTNYCCGHKYWRKAWTYITIDVEYDMDVDGSNIISFIRNNGLNDENNDAIVDYDISSNNL